MKNKINLMLGIIISVLVLTSAVSAFGVSSPYWEGNPMNIARGDSKIVNLNLQNMVGDEEVNVNVIGDEVLGY